MTNKIKQPKVGARKRNAYSTPKLTRYGSVAKLTAGIGGSVYDPGQTMTTKHGKG